MLCKWVCWMFGCLRAAMGIKFEKRMRTAGGYGVDAGLESMSSDQQCAGKQWKRWNKMERPSKGRLADVYVNV